MAGKRQPIKTDPSAEAGPDVGTNSEGEPNAELGQVLAKGSTAPSKSIVFGSSNKKALYAIRNGKTEPIDYNAMTAALAAGWKILPDSYPRRFRNLLAGGSTGSKQLYCPVVTDVTIGWRQANAVYTRVTAAAREFLGQTEIAGAKSQIVVGGNYFIFATPYGDIAAGTVITKKALKATVRFKAATSTATTSDSGLYTSYAKGDLADSVV